MNILWVVWAVGIVLLLARLFQGKKKTSGLSKTAYTTFKLISKTDVISPDVGMHTILFRFELPAGTTLGLPTGQHVIVAGVDEAGKPVARPYTPVSDEDTVGYVDLIIKIYPQGKMGNYLKNLPIGSMVKFKGPSGECKYLGDGHFRIRRKDASGASTEVDYNAKKVGMIAGGTGITPMLQLIRHIRKHNSDPTEVNLIFGNVSEENIMCRQELEDEQKNNTNFHLCLTVDKDPGAHWKGCVGFVTKDMIKTHLPPPGPDTMIILCGPPKMCELMTTNLVDLNYDRNNIFVY